MHRYFFVYDVGMLVVFPVDDGVETGLVIGRVLDDALRTVRLDQSVASLDYVTLSLLFLTLHVTGVFVVYEVFEFVLWMRVVRFLLVFVVVVFRFVVTDWCSVVVVDWCGVM